MENVSKRCEVLTANLLEYLSHYGIDLSDAEVVSGIEQYSEMIFDAGVDDTLDYMEVMGKL